MNPRSSLALRKHAKLFEHWVVVRGTAEVTCGDKVVVIYENQSTYIPLGEIHQLTNHCKELLEIIELQPGLTLDENDAVRYEDKY